MRSTFLTLAVAMGLFTSVVAMDRSSPNPRSRQWRVHMGEPQFFGGADFLGFNAYLNSRSAPVDARRYSAVLFVGTWSFGAVVLPQSSALHFGPFHFFKVRFSAGIFECLTMCAGSLLAVGILAQSIRRHARQTTDMMK